jgi:hypothetical protein
LNIEAALSTANHPETDGQTERVNQTLEQYLRIFGNYYQDNWTDQLPLAEFAYNNMTNASTKFSPFFANYGYHPTADNLTQRNDTSTVDMLDRIHETMDLLHENLVEAQETQARYANRTRQEAPFKVGDMVWLSTKNVRTTRPSKKLDYKRLGPFPITRQINPVAFELSLPADFRIHNVFHASLLSPFVANTIPGREVPPPPPVEVEGVEEYEVEEILKAKKNRGGQVLFKVLWRGYALSEATWESWENLTNCDDKLAEFYRRYPRAAGIDLWRTSRAKPGGDVMIGPDQVPIRKQVTFADHVDYFGLALNVPRAEQSKPHLS